MSKTPIIIGVVVLMIILGVVMFFMMKGEEPSLGPSAPGPSQVIAPAVAPAAPKAAPAPVVTFYDLKGYKGASTKKGVGKYKLNEMGIKNDTISALKVPKGLKVVLYKNNNFKGGKATFTKSDSNLKNNKFDNVTSSFVITKA